MALQSTLTPFRFTLALAAALSILVGCTVSEFDESMTPPDQITSRVNANAAIDPQQYPEFNPFIDTTSDNLATFSVDVDTASYTIMRRALNEGKLPDPSRMRIEEFVNYFKFDYPTPTTNDPEPFSISLEAAPSYFGENLHMLRVGVRGETIPDAQRPHTNIVFLIDISGSMASYDKIGFVKYSLKTLVNALREDDTVGIVVYAGDERVVLEPTQVRNRTAILNAVDSLTTGGSTNGEAGIRKAYELAQGARCSNNPALYQSCNNDINRVVLCTDGDFNVGLDDSALVSEVASWGAKGIALTVLGYGSDNLDDAVLEDLTNRGNGNYYYIDSHNEARRVLETELGGTMQIIAKDVKVQVEFNSDVISRYRLVGYENRVLNDEDFANDKIDAGDIGSGHNVTALLEFELRENVRKPSTGILQIEVEPAFAAAQFIDVRVRYKEPNGTTSKEVVKIVPLSSLETSWDQTSNDFRFAAAVTEFAEILRHSPFVDAPRFDEVHSLAQNSMGDQTPNRTEFLELVLKARDLWTN